MRITLSHQRRVRAAGAVVGAAFGIVAIVPSIISDGPMFPDADVGVLVLIIGSTLGWLFAPSAMEPGIGNALLVSAVITVIAIPVGAFLVAAAMGIDAGVSPGDAILGGIAIGLSGVVFLGVPLGMLTFVVANIWVGATRVLVRASGWEPATGAS